MRTKSHDPSTVKSTVIRLRVTQAEAELFRNKAKESFKMFYNPMWRFFGDYQKPFGTLFYSGASGDNIYWHIFDQVMIRPCLRSRFVDDSLQIITDTLNCSLVNRKGYPDVDRLSDHLPITFEIQEEV